MLDLKINIEKNNVYINNGNIFSKILLLKKYFTSEKSLLLIVENEKKQNLYLKIGEFLGIKLDILNNYSHLINLIYNKQGIFIVTKDFFNQKIDNFNQIEYKNLFEIKQNDSIEIQEITKKLNEFNYKFGEYKNPGTFKITGDVLNFTDLIGNEIIISFWGNNIDFITINNEKINKYFFGINKPFDIYIEEKFNNELKNKIGEENILMIIDSLDFYSNYEELTKGLNNYIIFDLLSNKSENIDLQISDLYIEKLEDLKIILEEDKAKKFIFTKNKNTINNFIKLNDLVDIEIYETSINNLKSFRTNSTIIICDDNISRIFIKKRIKRSVSKNLDLMMQIKPGDYIVHIDHGVGIFRDITTKELTGIKKEYITLEYKNNDKLFVPITEVGRVSKYIGIENPKLTGLNTTEWQRKLNKVKENVEEIAGELLDLYAKRKIRKGFSFLSFKEKETKFINSFEFNHTKDQLNIINEIYTDMESENPMDRLLSGDVGFGKTEIAFTTIYKAIINGKQTALISPLVVLAYEHFEKAKERFQGFDIKIEVLTRFEKPKKVTEVINKLKLGEVDLVIGTHRLLSEDIEFKDLGLLIIDEEHKFGVKDKEKIKNYKGNIDILSMSATPIPRSMNMALNGIKSISTLTLPPIGRQAINTIVSNFDDKLILEAGKREFERGGQVFFIHNRVRTIEAMKNYLQIIFPKKKIVITHGQLPGDTLEQRIIEFKRKQFDILLSTTVIENGIDFPNVNTIFINEAEHFGISQIHQLRGRVGRSEKKGYCYLLFKKDKINEDGVKKLKTIVHYSHLGAGFELAIKDLEIRGGGDILGTRQSGQHNEIGINLFLEMLENKIEELKQKIDKKPNKIENKNMCSIDLNIGAYLEDSYFASELDKINFYREIESIDNLEDLENIISDFKEINNDLSKTTINFFNLLKLKIKATSHKIKHIKKVGINYQIDFDENISLEELKAFLKLDKEVKFNVVNINRLRSLNKNFANEEKFIQYLLQLFDNKILNYKIKLKK